MRLHGYCTGCRRIRLVRVSGHGMAMIAARGVPQGICDECEQKQLPGGRTGSPWPLGILSRVSREAYNAVGRSRGFQSMTPDEREAAAVSYDQLKRRRKS